MATIKRFEDLEIELEPLLSNFDRNFTMPKM